MLAAYFHQLKVRNNNNNNNEHFYNLQRNNIIFICNIAVDNVYNKNKIKYIYLHIIIWKNVYLQ